MNRILAAALTSLALLTLAPAAFADVVGPEPTSCPEGGQPATCHGGPHCRPLGCMTDADCQNGLVCKDRSFCVGVVNCAGGLPPDADPSIYDVQTVESACSPGDTCDGGAACSTLKVCVSSDSTGSSTSSSGGNSDDIAVESGCGCRLASSRAGLSALALALGALAGLGMRRRKQR